MKIKNWYVNKIHNDLYLKNNYMVHILLDEFNADKLFGSSPKISLKIFIAILLSPSVKEHWPKILRAIKSLLFLLR